MLLNCGVGEDSKMEFEVFIKEGSGINTCGRERKKQEWVEEKLSCGAGPTPWASGAGNGNPLQYSCLENSMDRGAWWTTVHGIAKSQR